MLTQATFDTLLKTEGDFLGPLDLALEAVETESVTVRLKFDPQFLRPGGTVSGPTLFALSDVAMWFLAIHKYPQGKMALTTDLTMHFLRASRDRDLLARARALRTGRRLLVCRVTIVPDGEVEPLCHATGTYSVPSGSATHPSGGGA